MIVKSAEFLKSSVKLDQCPEGGHPEFAFIGRSNVGKSSLINMLVNRKDLAKVSNTPGKTQAINHFEINNEWYLVDLPGYGFAKVSKEERHNWGNMIEDYLVNRQTLVCVFVLIDSRLKPQGNDLDFLDFLGEKQVPFVIVFTKTDKIKKVERKKNIERFNLELSHAWENLPMQFISSSKTKVGKNEILDFVESYL